MCLVNVAPCLYLLSFFLPGTPAAFPPPGTGVQEYCESETFRARCLPNEVIVMDSALYGRMRTGRCVETDVGFLGCTTDVLFLTDRMCSGKRECEVRIPDKELDKTEPCFKELKVYLEASYHCVPVITPESSTCASTVPVELRPSRKSGYLSSLVSQETACGTSNAPWVISSLPGQRINITMLDFSAVYPTSTNSDMGYGHNSHASRKCNRYGTISEGKDIPHMIFCQNTTRWSHLYTSETHVVKVNIHIGPEGRTNGRFLLHYRVIGCPDLVLPLDKWFRRLDERSAVVGCQTVKTTWHLVCQGNEWVGETGNCSRNESTIHYQQGGTGKSGSIPHGFSLIVVISVTVGVSLAVLLLGIFALRSHRKNRRASNTAYTCTNTSETPENQKIYISSTQEALEAEQALYNIEGSLNLPPCCQQYSMGTFDRKHYMPMWESSTGAQTVVTCTCRRGCTPSSQQTPYNTIKVVPKPPVIRAEELRLWSPEEIQSLQTEEGQSETHLDSPYDRTTTDTCGV